MTNVKLEHELAANSQAVHIAGNLSRAEVVATIVDVLDLYLPVQVQVPIEGDVELLQPAPVHAAVVQVEVVVASGQLPGAPAKAPRAVACAHSPEIRERAGDIAAAQAAETAVIASVFAGQ